MAMIGWHASHEQLSPSTLLQHAKDAEAAGFRALSCSDHLQPWSRTQGQSGFAWSWLGAALSSTSLPASAVTTPGWRYHPAVLAQAIATLGEMFPSRFAICLGSGEALNERVVGRGWPPKAERNDVLRRAVGVVRALLAGETVNERCAAFVVEQARLWTRPAQTPLLVGAALSPETARFVGGFCDGLITVNQPREQLQKILDAFREGGGAGKPTWLQVHVAWAPREEDALAAAFAQWRELALKSLVLAELSQPEQFEEAARYVRPDDMRAVVRVSSDLGQQAAWLADDVALGFDRVVVHQVPLEQRRFFDAWSRSVLPQLR